MRTICSRDRICIVRRCRSSSNIIALIVIVALVVGGSFCYDCRKKFF